jgi:hypothetical protein
MNSVDAVVPQPEQFDGFRAVEARIHTYAAKSIGTQLISR